MKFEFHVCVLIACVLTPRHTCRIITWIGIQCQWSVVIFCQILSSSVSIFLRTKVRLFSIHIRLMLLHTQIRASEELSCNELEERTTIASCVCVCCVFVL